MEKKKVVIALSGGVDSAACAIIAKEMGHEIIGATLILKDSDVNNPVNQEILKELSTKLNFPHHYIDCREKFLNKVIKPCAETYFRGQTPNPCCLCNPVLKFKELLAFTQEVGADELWTGHYAQIENGKLYKGVDLRRDQSYFLYRLPEDYLKKIHFPLGPYTSKDEIRALLKDYNFPFHNRPDSQDVCFGVPGVTCGETLRILANLPEKPGHFSYNGKIVGHHKGIHIYTIGQREGLGVALGVPAYISKIDASRRRIELTTNSNDLMSTSFIVSDLVFTANQKVEDCKVKIRYRSSEVECKIIYHDNYIEVFPKTPLRAVTCGQSAVFYLDNQVIFGGIIKEAKK